MEHMWKEQNNINITTRVKINSALVNVIARAALKASRGLIRDFGEIEKLQVSKKGPYDFVSTADKRSEKIVVEELKKARPNYGFCLEESGIIQGKDPHSRWIVDPLDGTTNFLHGIPYFAISIGVEKDGEVIAGVVYDPLRDELFYAEKGMGAFANDQRLRVSSRTALADSLVSFSYPPVSSSDFPAFKEKAGKIEKEAGVSRRFGASTLELCYVAAGRIDGYCALNLAPWDIAAASIIIKEAGGYITKHDGQKLSLEDKEVLASNSHIHASLIKTIS
jgi:myo-inositol-1(or 4)-monophosphatase